MKDCVFCKIAKHEIQKEFIYEDKDIMVFPDLNPWKPIHILVVPKKHIEDILDLDDYNLLKKTKIIIDKVVKDHKLDKKGFRISVNGGGAQVINHLHFHVIGPISQDLEV